MAVYAITGKLGAGKGKAAIQRLREYIRQGKRVATNCDVFLEHLLPPHSRACVIRVPDKPSSVDLYAIGSGNKYIDFQPIIRHTTAGFVATPPSPKILKGFDECHNGALILDECGSWLNARTFGDKGRSDLLEWCIHARKYGWDVYFVMQNINQIDKQLRESLFEYVVRLNRLDRMKVPIVSPLVKGITAGAVSGSLPRVHIGVVRLGSSPDGLVADRWVFRGDDLNDAYNTTQVFSDSYPHAIHSLLPNWHRVGYALPEPVPIGIRIARYMGFMQEPKRKPKPKPKNRIADLIMRLPPDQRLKHFQRLQALGAI
jgi:hypothetical protein